MNGTAPLVASEVCVHCETLTVLVENEVHVHCATLTVAHGCHEWHHAIGGK